MLYMVFCRDIEEDEAVKLINKPVLEYPDSVFDYMVRESDDDICENEHFQNLLKKIDSADVPMRNVIRHLPTGDTHDIYKTSTGVKTLWLARISADYIFLSEWFGGNCYQELFDIAQNVDVYLYDDSDMFNSIAAENLTGQFVDYKTKEVIDVSDNDKVLEYLEERGYY